jgi:MFS family permease
MLTRDAAAASVRRNVLLLAGGMACLYGMVELAAGAATLTFEATGGSDSLEGVAPAVYIASSALAAFPAGRTMDRVGRVRVLQAGFLVGIVGSLSAALGVQIESLALAMLGFVLAGAATGTVFLSRAAAADMYPPERRPRGIALVLFGAIFGALLGPAVFIPLIGSAEGGGALAPAWLGAAGFMAVGLVLMTRVRPDPRDIATAMGHDESAAGGRAQPLRAVLARPGVVTALVAAVASWSAMVSVMTLTGSALVDHGHSESAVFPVIAAHFVGMFGLFALVAPVLERVGRTAGLAGGLLLLAASVAALTAVIHSVPLSAMALFGVGLGWSLSYVAATSELAERSAPAERGMLLGFSDLVSGSTGAGMAIAGGAGLSTAGLTAVALGAGLVPACAAAWIVAAALRPAGQPG